MGEGPEHNPFAPPAEHADFQVQRTAYDAFHLATYGQRFAGSVIDSLLYVPTLMPAFAMGWFSGISEDDFSPLSMLLIVLGPLLLASYQWTMTAKTGQTLAKRWLRTRVVRDGLGTAPGFMHGVLLRNWLFIAAGFVPGIGSLVGITDAVMIFSGGRRQMLHDRVAQTIVIQE